MHHKDEMKSQVERAKGSVEEQLGDMTGDDTFRGEGEADKLSGNARETLGK